MTGDGQLKVVVMSDMPSNFGWALDYEVYDCFASWVGVLSIGKDAEGFAVDNLAP